MGQTPDSLPILVTGANGFVGHHLCRYLLVEADRPVIATVHHGSQCVRGLGLAAVVSCDVLDRRGLDALFAAHGPIGTVCHLATEPPGEGPRLGVNVGGTRNVLAAAAAAGVRHVVFTSTMSVFDFLHPDLPLPLSEDHPASPRDSYGAEKLEAEGQCLGAAEGLTVTVLRLAGVYGPGKRGGAVYRFVRAALEQLPVDIAVDRRVDLLWVEDAVRALRAATVRPPEARVLHVGSGSAVPLSEVARRAAEAVGARVEIRFTGPGTACGNAFCLDIGRARRQLDFEPTPLAEALQRFAPSVAADLSADVKPAGTASRGATA